MGDKIIDFFSQRDTSKQKIKKFNSFDLLRTPPPPQ